jgi:hypothetical protein
VLIDPERPAVEIYDEFPWHRPKDITPPPEK